MTRKIKTASGSEYILSEEMNTLSGGRLPRPMAIAYIRPLFIDGKNGISATLADPQLGMVRIETTPVVKISGLVF